MKRSTSLPVGLTGACVLTFLSGCAGIETKIQDPGSAKSLDGIAYYLPKRLFKLTVSVDSTGKQTPAISQSDTLPDLSKRFVLSYNESYVGTNHVVLTISTKGLLEASNSSTTSGISQIAKNLGTAAGEISALAGGLGSPPPGPGATCQAGQSYSIYVAPSDLAAGKTLCNFALTGVALSKPTSIATTPRALSYGKAQSGIFYRQDIPYKLTATDAVNKIATEFIVYAPDDSEISYAPVTKTLFSNSATNYTLVDGTLTGVDATSDGEIVSLSELPADVISAYFTAVGSLFSSLGSSSTAKKTLLQDQQDLSTQRAKFAACKAVIGANDLAAKTGSDLTQAVQAITTACQ